jgi:hypothetical protein
VQLLILAGVRDFVSQNDDSDADGQLPTGTEPTESGYARALALTRARRRF